MNEYKETLGYIAAGVLIGLVVARLLKDNLSEESMRAVDNAADSLNCDALKTSEAHYLCIGAKAGYQGGKRRRLK